MPCIGLISFLPFPLTRQNMCQVKCVNALYRAYIISTPVALEALILAASGARFCKQFTEYSENSVFQAVFCPIHNLAIFCSIMFDSETLFATNIIVHFSEYNNTLLRFHNTKILRSLMQSASTPQNFSYSPTFINQILFYVLYLQKLSLTVI